MCSVHDVPGPQEQAEQLKVAAEDARRQGHESLAEELERASRQLLADVGTAAMRIAARRDGLLDAAD